MPSTPTDALPPWFLLIHCAAYAPGPRPPARWSRPTFWVQPPIADALWLKTPIFFFFAAAIS
jgi:hypothetical protein